MSVKHVVYVRNGWGMFTGRYYMHHASGFIGSVCPLPNGSLGKFAEALVRDKLGPGQVEFRYL